MVYHKREFWHYKLTVDVTAAKLGPTGNVAAGTITVIHSSLILQRAALVNKRSWISRDTSRATCSSTTATFAWKQNETLWNRS